ncbi:unnamed protein product [Larinioides sclopetarius]|uniref:Uncharacterized protein n=1 Tax=Larinioides sclopetarius TaxID=280406 RepID=A0AAV2C0A9_9ARAC
MLNRIAEIISKELCVCVCEERSSLQQVGFDTENYARRPNTNLPPHGSSLDSKTDPPKRWSFDTKSFTQPLEEETSLGSIQHQRSSLFLPSLMRPK